MSVSTQPRNPVAEPELAAIWMQHVRDMTRTLNNPLPEVPNFLETTVEQRRSADGRLYKVTIQRLFSGTPFFRLIERDLHDSHFYYPIIWERVLAAPRGITEAASHKDWFYARRERRKGRGIPLDDD